MTTKEQTAVDFFAVGYNCAQSVLGSFCEDGGLDRATAFRLANGFGGGIRCGEVCGAVTGAIMAIGLKCGFSVEGDFAQKGFCNRKAYEFIERFRRENGSIICRELFGVDIRSPDDFNRPESQEPMKTICPNMIASAVRILESMDFGRDTP